MIRGGGIRGKWIRRGWIRGVDLGGGGADGGRGRDAGTEKQLLADGVVTFNFWRASACVDFENYSITAPRGDKWIFFPPAPRKVIT